MTRLTCGQMLGCAVMAVILAYAAAGAEPVIAVDSAYPGGNVRVLSVDEASGIVRVAPDLRDTEGYWFHFDFTVRGAAGRTLKFRFPQDNQPYLSSLGPAICRDGVQWTWLNADGKRHEPANALALTNGRGACRTPPCRPAAYSAIPFAAASIRTRQCASSGRIFSRRPCERS